MSAVILIPTVLSEDAIDSIPAYVLPAIRECQVLFVENERTARRYLKQLDKAIVIDAFEWHAIHKAEAEQVRIFLDCLRAGKQVGIISEAGCPGIADPGQILVEAAQAAGFRVKPMVGPSSILMALMASGMNGQHFEFLGYLPVDAAARNKQIRELEASSQKNASTKIFIETPYRNNQLLESLVSQLQGKTRLCVAVDITGPAESIRTKTIAEWKKNKPDLHKIPAIFLVQA